MKGAAGTEDELKDGIKIVKDCLFLSPSLSLSLPISLSSKRERDRKRGKEGRMGLRERYVVGVVFANYTPVLNVSHSSLFLLSHSSHFLSLSSFFLIPLIFSPSRETNLRSLFPQEVNSFPYVLFSVSLDSSSHALLTTLSVFAPLLSSDRG